MRRVWVVAGIVLMGLGLALYFALTRTEVEGALARGEAVHLLWIVQLFADEPPDFALSVSLHPQGRVTWILIPGELAFPEGGPWRTLREVYLGEGKEGWSRRISGLLGLNFLRTVVLRPGDWERLVEAVGGVVVRPEERLHHHDPTRAAGVDFPPGEQLLGGPRSREFLVYSLRYAGDPSLTLGLSFLRDFVARLWERASAGVWGLSPEGDWESRAFWRRALAVPAGAVGVQPLPVVAEGARLMPDIVRARKLREGAVFGRSPLTRDEVRIMVLNGTRERFLATRTAAWLSARGFQVNRVGSADRSDYLQTYLVVGPGAEGKAELLRALLPPGTVVSTAQAFGVEKLGPWPSETDLVLVVGAGFGLEF